MIVKSEKIETSTSTINLKSFKKTCLKFFTKCSWTQHLIWGFIWSIFNYQRIGAIDTDLRVICLRCLLCTNQQNGHWMMAHSESKWACISTSILDEQDQSQRQLKPVRNKTHKQNCSKLFDWLVARSDSLSVCNPPRRQLSSETHQHFCLGLSIQSTGLTTNIVFICYLFILN